MSEFAKLMRDIRFDVNDRLLDMAEKLKVSSAFVSAVEKGRKPIPASFEELIIKAYFLDEVKSEALRRAADRARESFLFRPKSEIQKDTLGLLARKMEVLDDSEFEKIFKIVRGGKSE